MAPFRRVVRVAKPIVKARKPQSCALFSFQILRFSSRCPAFCSCVPVLCSGGQPFYFRWSGILPLGCPQFYLRGPGLSSHSTFYLPKGSLSPSRFCFSVPNVQYYVTKAHYYHIQANIPCNSRTKTPILCSGSPKTRVSDPKSAQKPRFCARNARKQEFQTPKAHKNHDFVLEMLENEGSEPQKRTKNPILCSGR